MSAVDPIMTNLIAQEIRRNAACLEGVYNNLVTKFNEINSCIETLKSYNGSEAGGFEILDGITIFKKIWKININYNTTDITNSTNVLNEISENIELLNISGEDLEILAEKLGEYMNELSQTFGVEVNPNPIVFFNELACKEEWQNKKYDYLYNELLKEKIMDKLLEKGYFKKYDNLNEEQYMALARVCAQEQGSNNLEGIAIEASFMCNLYEYDNQGYDNIYDYVKNNGWWNNSEDYMDGTADYYDNPINDEIVRVVKEVFCDGRRTLPIYINEHDYTGDLSYIDTNGVYTNPNDANSYVQNVSRCVQSSSSFDTPTSYTFYGFAGGIDEQGNPIGDPFGTADWGLHKKEKYGDFHFDFTTGNLVYNDDDLNKILSNNEIISINREITSKIDETYGLK